MRKPMRKLLKVLYDHPEPGGHWEQHCEAHVMAQGFKPIPEWQSCYFHEGLKLYLVVCVDDFKLSGPKEHLAEGWRLIRTDTAETKGIEMGDPTPLGRYLGCEHVLEKRKSPITGKMVNSIVYDMSDFFKQYVTN